jgi:hypothetical protein
MPFGIGQKSQAATRGRSPKNLPTLLADRLNEKVYVTIDGRQRKRAAVRCEFPATVQADIFAADPARSKNDLRAGVRLCGRTDPTARPDSALLLLVG